MDLSARIFIAGHRGLVGAALVRRLTALGASNLIVRTHAELDLIDGTATTKFFDDERPEYVFLAAAKVGGIKANDTYPAEFLRDNLAIQTNVIHAAWASGVKKLCFLGSSCIYPKLAPQPIGEESLLTGTLEPTNEWYAIAKIAGLKMCQAYRKQYGFDAISVMPTNLYGPHDNFDPDTSHVLPALLRRIHEAKLGNSPAVVIWGTGSPLREFLHVDDMADATVHLMRHYTGEQHVNVGVGSDLSILQLARLIAQIVGYTGEIKTDPTKPDGTPRKLLNVERLHAQGWRARIELADGIASTYRWYLSQTASAA
ncbi:MAG: GDP-L-fucose synthase [Burkholderiales bacterium]|nr:MAG: GDP-L-fucose synthase [Betaproteobacteria bacterium]TAG28349.1 MAG: GDP-L-fucose synthase [Burkholderiales bacterium]